MNHAHMDGWGVVMGGPFEWIGGLLAFALTIAFWVIVALVIVKLVKSRPMSIGAAGSGLRLLEERYARGEITRDEFLERKAVLTGESTTAPL